MKRTSLMLDENLLKEIRQLAKTAGISLKNQFHLVLREGLRNLPKKQEEKYKFSPIITKGIAEPKVNIADRNQLFDVFDVNNKLFKNKVKN